MNLVVVPVLCNPVMTKKCLDSVLDQDTCTTPFVIDNGSTDCSTLLRSYGKRISRITHPETVSLNKVWNDALDTAFRSLKLDHCLVINNDVVLRPDCYRVLLADGGGFVTGVGVEDPEQLKRSDPSSRSPHPTFSCFLIRSLVWALVGKFDERYWAWCSDADYHLRMDRMGIEAYAINLPFLHIGSGTLKHTLTANRKKHNELCLKSDADRAEFLRQYGFAVGSDQYYAAFRHARANKYATTGAL